LATAPVNLFFNLANGFHNLPAHSFGDDTVRERQEIVDIASGLAVAGKEVLFGVYDGITGLATHPYHGYTRGRHRKSGAIWGATIGVGRGVGGLLARSGAVVFALPGYGLKGVEQQILRWGDKPDRISEVSSKMLEEFCAQPTDHGVETRRKAMEEWLVAAEGKPLLQRRIVQSFLDIEEMVTTTPEVEGEICEKWKKLMEGEKTTVKTFTWD